MGNAMNNASPSHLLAPIQVGPAFAGLILGIVLVGLVETIVWLGIVPAFVLPAPSTIVAHVPSLFIDENIAVMFCITFGIIFIATGFCAVVGVPAGWLLYRYRAFGEAYEPWLAAIFSAPIILLYPLFLVVIGRSPWTILAMGVMGGITPVILTSYKEFVRTPKVYYNVAHSMSMSPRDTFLKVLLPAALPGIFTGVRLSMIYVMINVVAVEYLMSMGGLGYLISDLYDRFDIPGMYGAVIFVVVASVLFYVIAGRVEAWLKRM